MKEASAINSATLCFSSTAFSWIEDLDLEELDLVLLLDEWYLLCSFSASSSQLYTLCLKENVVNVVKPGIASVLFIYVLKLFMDIHKHLEHVTQLN